MGLTVSYVSHADEIIDAIDRAAKATPAATVDTLVERVQERAPVLTGRLKNSIHREGGDSGTSAYFVIGVDYWPFPEFGTRYQRAQPYITPVWDTADTLLTETFMRFYNRG